MTKSDDKRVPALRFKGFTDEWEQRKLGDYGSVAMNKRIFKNQTNTNSGVPFYKIGTFGKKADAFISKKLFEEYRKKYPYPKKGDLLISASGSIGRVIEYTGQQAYYQDSNIVWLNHNDNLENIYLKAYYQIIHWSGIEGSTIKRLYNKNILNTKIYVPIKDEQFKVGTIIDQIEKLITLQQRKLTELQLLRTSLNQQLLKDNSSWKSVKLREILNIRNKQIFPNQQYPLMSFVQKQGVVPKSQRYNRDFLVKGNKKYKVTEKGDFIYSSNNLETGSIGINKTGNATISPVYSVFSSKNYKESLFIGLLSEKKSFIYKMIRFRQGVVYGQWKIPEKDFLNIKIKIPNYQEQEKIITLFTHIDNQFKQENKKLTDLQNFKQFLLQNMFI
ncbi:restriction endonuclease subunit S [Lactobacillus johnsonii]